MAITFKGKQVSVDSKYHRINRNQVIDLILQGEFKTFVISKPAMGSHGVRYGFKYQNAEETLMPPCIEDYTPFQVRMGDYEKELNTFNGYMLDGNHIRKTPCGKGCIIVDNFNEDLTKPMFFKFDGNQSTPIPKKVVENLLRVPKAGIWVYIKYNANFMTAEEYSWNERENYSRGRYDWAACTVS